jgi:ADP-ribosyl-[dinitrogen reductase] hydrolase
MRTSVTHPLQIAEVPIAEGFGKIGMTFCPGKYQSNSATGGWARDLDLDLTAIEEWGAAALVTLMEEHELRRLQVPDLGPQTLKRHLVWHHLPLADQAAPGALFEASWRKVGPRLRSLVRNGFGVVFHCKGGLGRTGTLAARLLVELGWAPQEAISAVRRVRPGAIENRAQEKHVLALSPVDEIVPDTSLEAMRSRAIGAMLGLALGDAIGTSIEFRPRDSYEPLQDMVGGGPFRLRPGQWTDDTAMALALLDSLLSRGALDEADLMTRFTRWWREGAYSSTGACFDIGVTTRAALERWERTGDPIAGSPDPLSAGNGSLMRLSPILVGYFRDRDRMRDFARRQSATTHAAPEAMDACVAFSELIADAINGRPLDQILSPFSMSLHMPYAGAIETIMQGSWRGKRRTQIKSSGYVAHSLEAAIWCVARTGTFAEAVLLAANLGDDADTTAAITGQLAGGVYGVEGIPQSWREKIAWGHQIETDAARLFDRELGLD